MNSFTDRAVKRNKVSRAEDQGILGHSHAKRFFRTLRHVEESTPQTEIFAVENVAQVALTGMIRPETALWLRYLEFTNYGKMVRWKTTVALICKNAKSLNLDRGAREDEVYSLVRNNGLKTIPG